MSICTYFNIGTGKVSWPGSSTCSQDLANCEEESKERGEVVGISFEQLARKGNKGC